MKNLQFSYFLFRQTPLTDLTLQASDKVSQSPPEGALVPSTAGDSNNRFTSKPLLRPTFSLKAVVGIYRHFPITNIDFLS